MLHGARIRNTFTGPTDCPNHRYWCELWHKPHTRRNAWLLTKAEIGSGNAWRSGRAPVYLNNKLNNRLISDFWTNRPHIFPTLRRSLLSQLHSPSRQGSIRRPVWKADPPTEDQRVSIAPRSKSRVQPKASSDRSIKRQHVLGARASLVARRKQVQPASPRIISAARSPIRMQGALVLVETMVGMIDASATRNP